MLGSTTTTVNIGSNLSVCYCIMKLYSKKEIDIYIKKLLELKWDTYNLYLVGGALYKQETKDIDICIVGRNDSNKVFKLMEQSRSLGPFDVYYW